MQALSLAAGQQHPPAPCSPAAPPVNGVRTQRHTPKGVGEAVQVGAGGGQELVPGVRDAHAAQLADVHAPLRQGSRGGAQASRRDGFSAWRGARCWCNLMLGKSLHHTPWASRLCNAR